MTRAAKQITKATDIVRDAIFGVEPALRQIDGLIKVISLLGEASDSVDPAALAALGRAGHEAVMEINSHWHAALSALKDGG